ncbi:hypothetical protein [Acinetobacter bereziniae]|uniref:hypothetical protein n=1 Tax=Acinetobacter bereziniae TaxID=106648 RepID=UPI00124EB8BB|nr:hypothetical protein [Acinetobacter bereziniae]MBJ8554172.1 hypothetical protein [Acinetobacter bereziniae]
MDILIRILALLIGINTNVSVHAVEKNENQHYSSQNSDCISLNVIHKMEGKFNLKNICDFTINLKYTLSKSQIFAGSYITLAPNQTTFSTGQKDERVDFIICRFPDIPEKIGGSCIGSMRTAYTGSLVNNVQNTNDHDDELDRLMDNAQKEGDSKLTQINNHVMASLNTAQQNYNDSLISLNKMADSLQGYTNRINASGFMNNNIASASKNTEKASTLNVVQNILSDFVNKQNSVAMNKYQSTNSALGAQQRNTSLNGITASDFGGDENCTDEYLTRMTQPLIQKLSSNVNNIGACEGAKRIKTLHLKVLDITKQCRSNTIGIKEVRQGSINAIQEANQTIEGICGS